MVQKIALFNHRGGVGKTTTTFNLGSMLASKGKRVILVDADFQCDLTLIGLGEKIKEDKSRIEAIYNTRNIKIGLAPAFEAQPKAIEAVDCIPLEGQERLFLLPGHVGFAEYEVTLGIAQELSGSIQTLKNLPGAISDLLEKTAQKFNADYILIDMSPSLGAINQNLLMTSDFFLIPITADFFSVKAIESLARILPIWCAWANMAVEHPIIQKSVYPFPKFNLRFLGTVVNNYRYNTPDFEIWINELNRAIYENLIPILDKHNILLPKRLYAEQGINETLTLTKITKFNNSIASSQKHQTTVYEFNLKQLGQKGGMLKYNQTKQEELKTIFSDLADKIIGLTSAYAVSA